MSDDSATTAHLSVAMTTTTQVTSLSSSGTEFYFQCAVVLIGALGTGANGIILYALIASQQHKKHALIVSQNALDCLGCLGLVVTYSLKLSNLQLAGPAGYWVCTLVLSEALCSSAISASIINLAAVTVERYLRVVHAAWSKTKRDGRSFGHNRHRSKRGGCCPHVIQCGIGRDLYLRAK